MIDELCICQFPGLSLGVTQMLLCSMATAKGIIFLLESTPPPPFPVIFGLPNWRHGQEPLSSSTPTQVHSLNISQICHFDLVCGDLAWRVSSTPNPLFSHSKDPRVATLKFTFTRTSPGPAEDHQDLRRMVQTLFYGSKHPGLEPSRDGEE